MRKPFILCVLFFFGVAVYAIENNNEGPLICREGKIGGIEFKFCVNKEEIKKDEECKIQFFAKIPKGKNIFVTYGDIWPWFISEKNEMIFSLGGANILGDYLPQFLDLKRYYKTKNNLYKDTITIKIVDLENQYKKNINGPLILRFLVSFAKEIKEPLKKILLTKSWYPFGDMKEKWFPDCFASFYENYVEDEEVGFIKIEIKDHDCPK
jgi:hypothetical protein